MRAGGRTFRRVVVVTAVVAGLISGTGQVASAAVTSVSGSAYGFFASISLFGGPFNTRGPAPTVTLPSGGSGPITASAATGSVVYGPAQIFTSGPITVSTQGTTGATGSVASSTDINDINTSEMEVFTADRLQSSCAATETGVSGSTTVTNGTIVLQDPNPDVSGEEGEEIVTLPTNPAPNTTYEGTVANVNDDFRAIFNEQVINPDGSITVYAYHLILLGPTAIGDLFVGKAECGVTSDSAPTTTTTSTSTTSTTTTTTTVPTTTTTTVPTTTTTTVPTTTTTTVPTTTTTLPDGTTCNGLEATIVGTERRDVIVGTPGDDVIVGLGGNDVIDGAGGNDVICGGQGNDTIRGGEGDDNLFGDSGNDLLLGEGGNDTLDGEAGNDRIDGGDGNDVIRGGSGDNTMFGGPGDDNFQVAPGSTGADHIFGGPGNDFIEAVDSTGIFANDFVDGGDGDDTVQRLEGGVFVGGEGDDDASRLLSGTFYGGNGDDSAGMRFGPGGIFYGGEGSDNAGSMSFGIFYGQGGNDSATVAGAGIFLGGEGDDVSNNTRGAAGLFCGGPGDDDSILLNTGGTFIGEEGLDEVGIFFGGTFVQDGECPVEEVVLTVAIGDTVASDGTRGQVRGTVVCPVGEAFDLALDLTQGGASATGSARGTCSGAPQAFAIGFATTGPSFTGGAATACVAARTGVVGSQEVINSAEVCEEVTVVLRAM